MTTRRVLAALAFAVGLALLAGRGGAAAEDDVRVKAQATARSVKLGEDIELKVRIENTSAGATTLAEPRLADDSVTIRITGAGVDALLVRRYGSFRRDDAGALTFRPRRTPRRRVRPGGSLRTTIRFAAVAAGDLTLTPLYARPDGTTVEGAAVSVSVKDRVPGATPIEAVIETSRGTLKVTLDGTRSFNSVSHFWTLARDGYFDGLRVHRVVPGVLAQSGDPRGDGRGGPGWYLPAERPVKVVPRGALCLARGAHADSAGSQWFVAVGEGSGANPFALGFTVIGHLTRGLDVADALAAAPVKEGTQRPVTPDRVTTVKVGR